MTSEDSPALPRLLTAGPDLLAAALVVLPALNDPRPAVLVVGAALLVCVVAGFLKRRRSLLAAVGVLWVTLLAFTPGAVWFAFPFYFLLLRDLPRRTAVAAVAATGLVAVAGFGWHQHVLTVGTVLGPLLGAAVAVATVVVHRESQRRAELTEELAAAERAAGVLAERERLAREVHDTLAQGLSSIHLLLSAALRGDTERHVRAARAAAADALAEARRFVKDQNPPALDGGSLPSALHLACASTAATADLAVHCRVTGDEVALPTTHQVALLRIAQSALGNVVSHAGATEVRLTLSYQDTDVTLDIVDNGRGITGAGAGGTDPDPAPGQDRGYGIAAMRARARALAGDLVVESDGRGTAIAVTLPVPVA
ncbi:histidine kinase [Actinokineospora diospyrosa]|uniref:Signal transduction histidine kinase n=1 Tax=Actinokineospora diospyrosa TaxID=103728 RepID=A0ABT1I974_9PSEU|nr:histidine kinase [Actinokineospora diospyrosa]MCP2269170.1 Signal transduction histidine kinase [Actinokineospora diospyrosa]